MSEPPAAPVVDLNSDLGEGFGIWTLGDDDALAGHRHQRQSSPAASMPATRTSCAESAR